MFTNHTVYYIPTSAHSPQGKPSYFPSDPCLAMVPAIVCDILIHNLPTMITQVPQGPGLTVWLLTSHTKSVIVATIAVLFLILSLGTVCSFITEQGIAYLWFTHILRQSSSSLNYFLLKTIQTWVRTAHPDVLREAAL